MCRDETICGSCGETYMCESVCRVKTCRGRGAAGWCGECFDCKSFTKCKECFMSICDDCIKKGFTQCDDCEKFDEIEEIYNKNEK